MKLPRPFRLSEIAALIGGRLEGPGDTTVSRVAMSPLAAGANDLALVFEPGLLRRLDECKAAAAVVPEGAKANIPSISVARPTLALQKMLSAVAPERFLPEPGVHPTAVVDDSAELGEDVAVGPLVVIGPRTRVGAGSTVMAGTIIGGDVSIGQRCLIHPGCLIADHVQIGNRVIMQQGASVGSDGFGYVTARVSNLEKRIAGSKDLSSESNPHLKIPQIGTVIIEDDVEVGSNSTIDRATIGATVIGRGSKLDNLVMIAHNCRIGEECIIVSQAGLAGSVTVGKRAVIAGQVGIKDHIVLGDDVILEGKAGVMRDAEDGEVLVGSPAVPHREFMTNVALTRKLPGLFDDLKKLRKEVQDLQEQLKLRREAT